MATIPTSLRTKNPLTLEELHLNEEVRHRIDQLLEEFSFIDALDQLGLPVDNKILLQGHTGCGKTATALAIGQALDKKVITVNLGGFVSSKLGETARNLTDLFTEAKRERAILFIDEFDFVGKLRDYDEKDSGEMKRLVNALIQQIDHLDPHTMLICATNHPHIIDTALLRRFQIRLNYDLPTQERLDHYYDSLLARFPTSLTKIDRVYDISFAEAKDRVYQQLKAKALQIEKQRMHTYFDYSREHKIGMVNAEEEYIKGYELSISRQSDLPIAQPSGSQSLLKGQLRQISGQDLLDLDRNKNNGTKRIKEKTISGQEVWLYIKD